MVTQITDLSASMEVEIFLRLRGRLPNKKGDGLTARDYKNYCDMVMIKKVCPRGRTYDYDGLWDYAWAEFKRRSRS